MRIIVGTKPYQPLHAFERQKKNQFNLLKYKWLNKRVE